MQGDVGISLDEVGRSTSLVSKTIWRRKCLLYSRWLLRCLTNSRCSEWRAAKAMRLVDGSGSGSRGYINTHATRATIVEASTTIGTTHEAACKLAGGKLALVKGARWKLSQTGLAWRSNVIWGIQPTGIRASAFCNLDLRLDAASIWGRANGWKQRANIVN